MTVKKIGDISKYLARIGLAANLPANDHMLHFVHRHHVLHVPFENLDIHYRNPFTLDLHEVYKKVVVDRRGGFCYELNLLFCWLLNELGFTAKIISARIVNEDGSLGPLFDHMCIHVLTTKHYLSDVGYGDLFLTPIEIKDGIQTDGRNFFKVDGDKDGFYLSMSQDSKSFKRKYRFSLQEVDPSEFEALSFEKQTHPNSYFVKNLVCTKATEEGRVTIFNDTLIVRSLTEKKETPILNDLDLRTCLMNYFEITLSERDNGPPN